LGHKIKPTILVVKTAIQSQDESQFKPKLKNPQHRVLRVKGRTMSKDG